jgi:hypothetical protein
MNNYDWLISRLDAFIRKYYINRLIRGSLLLVICFLFYVLMASVGEYFLYMPVWLRMGIVSLFIIAGAISLVWLIIIPLAKTARLGKVISYQQAAGIIGTHFPEISDKLLNILQLKQQADPHASLALIQASIEQKTSQISVVPFSQAINLSKNKKYLPFLLPLILIGGFIFIAAPNVFRDASERLLQPTKTFEKPAPFKFIIKTMPLQMVRNADYVLQIETQGDALPADMWVELGDERVPMLPMAAHLFQYTFKNVTEPIIFRLFAAGFYSQPYTLKVVQKPVLKTFKVYVDYPAYTGKKNEVRNSMSDMTLPIGTSVKWTFVAEHTDDATWRMTDGNPVKMQKDGTLFSAAFRFMNDTAYTISLHNKQSGVVDSYNYRVQIIPDQYPVVQLQEFRDTISGKQIVLNGTAGDDYGVARVLFHYDITTQKNQPVLNKSVPLKITSGALTTFQHYFDIQRLDLQPGQKLSYYIEAWDNDGVHGSKASRSEVMTYTMYNAKQIDSAINENSRQINSGISNSAQQTQKLQSDYKEMQSKMLESDQMDWEQKQSLQQMADKQNQLQNQVENIKKRFEEQIQQSKEKQYSDDVKQKQEDLKKQLDNVLNNELKEEMKKLQELMQKMNKDQAMQTMQQLEQENKLFQMDLKRIQELMKKLEMQMKMEDLANKMQDLANKQKALQKETDEGKKDNATLSKEQQDLKDELKKALEKDMKSMDSLNNKMQKPQTLDKPKESGKQAEKKMQQSKDQLDQKEGKKSSKSQSEAEQNLEEMAQSLMSMSSGMDMEEIEIDIKATRQVLSNLIRLSFDQEKLMKSVQYTSATSPQYLANQEEQNRLHSNSMMIRDSLFSFSKKVFKLATTINKETTDLERNMASALDAIENRRVGDAVIRQQYVMTHTNNLALMLNEILSNLLQQQRNAMKNPGNGSCSKPGGMNPKPGAGKQLSDIITAQQQLNGSMQKMQDGKKQGKEGGKEGKESKQGKDGKEGKDGNKEGKTGDKAGKGQGGGGEGGEDGENMDSEQVARMVQEQAALRRKIQQLNSLLNSKGMGNSKELREIAEKMDHTETELVNRRMSNELLLRQKEIMTRLMEAEKSLRQQEQDDKRSSQSAQDISRPVPPELQKYIQDRQKLLELYKTVPPFLKPYYKGMVEQYYQIIGNKGNGN